MVLASNNFLNVIAGLKIFFTLLGMTLSNLQLFFLFHLVFLTIQNNYCGLYIYFYMKILQRTSGLKFLHLFCLSYLTLYFYLLFYLNLGKMRVFQNCI